MDLILTDDHDLYVTDSGDIVLSEESTTAEELVGVIKTRLLWIAEEWRLGPDIGFPWFEEVLVKKPDFEYIMQLIQNEIMDIDDVQDCSVQLLSFDQATRHVTFEFHVTATDGSSETEEVEFDG